MIPTTSCRSCTRFFSRFQCSIKTHGECDCPRCQGFCKCSEQTVRLSKLLEKTYANCVPDGECMNWCGAVQSACRSPTMRINRPHGMSLRRAILEFANGGPLRSDLMATYICGNSRCVRLEHLAAVTKSEIQRRNESKLDAAARLRKSGRITEKARKRSKLTEDVARQIRDAEGPQREIAQRFGVSQTTVGSVRRGETWRDMSNPWRGLV